MGVQKLPEKQVRIPTEQKPLKLTEKKVRITTEQILDMGVQKLRKLPEKQVRKYLSQVFSAANKRVANLSKLEYKPTALKHVQASGITKFGVKGKTTKELWKQYAVVQDLWAQKSGTVKGAREVQENVFRIAAKEALLDEEGQKLAWKLYNRIIDEKILGGEVYVKQIYGSDNMQNFIFEEVTAGRTEDELMNKLKYMIDNQVRPEQTKDGSTNDTDDFWSFGQN